MDAPVLPTRFPCWVKAVYSWGGETKRDLGFVEGDLIECLNAGDGSWWMGRLRRDKRMIGLFPSNFVKVLDESYQPGVRHTSPAVPSGSTLATSSTQKAVFRKPFTAYAASGTSSQPGAKDANAIVSRSTPSPAGTVSKSWKPKPFSSMKKQQQAPASQVSAPAQALSRPIPAPIARTRSAQSEQQSRSGRAQSTRSYHTPSRNPSPKPSSRVPSPQPFLLPSRGTSPNRYEIRAPSPQQLESLARRGPSPCPIEAQNPSPTPYENAISPASYNSAEDSSSPPPPPPAHRIPYLQNVGFHSESSVQEQAVGGYHIPRTPSYASSVAHSGMTPSPLRDAMKDVLTSLEDMATPSPVKLETPPNIWSPEAFDEIYSKSAKNARPNTSLGFGHVEQDMGEETEDRISFEGGYSDMEHDGPPRLTNYVARMEIRLRELQQKNSMHEYFAEEQRAASPQGNAPAPPQHFPSSSRPLSSRSSSRPTTSYSNGSRPASSSENKTFLWAQTGSQRGLRSRKSAYELGCERLGRSFTMKSSNTNASSTAQSTSTNNTNHSQSTQLTSQSLMSGYSAGGFSATSAGSLARRKWGRTASVRERPISMIEATRPGTSVGAVSHHSSQKSNPGPRSDNVSEESVPSGNGGLLGGLATPSAKKRGFFQKILDSAKSSAANARSNMSTNQSSRPSSRARGVIADSMTAMAGTGKESTAAHDMVLGSDHDSGSMDWMQVRRDVNRSNSLCRNERDERAERCQLMDIQVINPTDILDQAAGDEGADGEPVLNPTEFVACNLALVDKSARFVNNIPAMTNSVSLAQGYICRPYKSDVQRLRAIFTWVAERIAWEEDFEGDIDTRRAVQTKRGCSEEIAVLVYEMCQAVGLHAEVVKGYLKAPGDTPNFHDLGDAAARPNHWWNAVVCDGEWRIMDCSLAGPTHPRRALYSAAGNQVAEGWWFLARPTQICYTHVPLLPEQQHVVTPLPHDVLMALPVACPPFFRNCMMMHDFDTSLIHLDNFEMAHIHIVVPDNVECIAEVEARAFAQDADGDCFENGDIIRKRALAQAEFVSNTSSNNEACWKQYTIKALLPSTASTAVLKVYAGRRGLMHGINNNPHPLALALPLTHEGANPEYEFFARHPTPHALRHEVYVVNPLCKNLAVGNNFVFTVRQHIANPNSSANTGPLGPGSVMSVGRPSSPLRPGSAMSMVSTSVSGSAYSNPSAAGSENSTTDKDGREQQKPAKLAIQTPSGKILRMARKLDVANPRTEKRTVMKLGSTWETIVKVGEKGTWRSLVLADRSARWCVFGEWECS